MNGERTDTCTTRVLAACRAPESSWMNQGSPDHTTSDRRHCPGHRTQVKFSNLSPCTEASEICQRMGWDLQRMEGWWWWVSGSVGSEGLNCMTRATNHAENSSAALLGALAFLGTLTAPPGRAAASQSQQWFSAVWPTALPSFWQCWNPSSKCNVWAKLACGLRVLHLTLQGWTMLQVMLLSTVLARRQVGIHHTWGKGAKEVPAADETSLPWRGVTHATHVHCWAETGFAQTRSHLHGAYSALCAVTRMQECSCLLERQREMQHR